MDGQPEDGEPEYISPQHSKAQEFKNSGNEKFSKSNYKGALVDYTKGLLQEPNNPELHANLSAAYLHLDKYIEAEEHALFAIHLRPNFYKGYLRAAKADHGKGMTKLAIKRLTLGLANVTDADGISELSRLKNQYTAYLSLQTNSERELDLGSDTYQSEDEEDEGLSTDEDSGDDQPPPSTEEPEHLAITSYSEQSTASVQAASTRPDTVEPEPVQAPLDPDTIQPDPIPDHNPPDTDRIQSEPIQSESTEQDPVEGDTIQPEPVVPSSEPSSDLPTYLSNDQCDDSSKRDMVMWPTTESTDSVADVNEGQENQEEKEDEREGKQDVALGSENPVKSSEPEISKDEAKHLEKDPPEDKSEDKQVYSLDWLRELARSSEMKKSIADFKENLKVGGEAFLSGNYRKAADNYKAAYERVGLRFFDFETEPRQCNVIRYASYTAMINLNTYDDLVKSIHGLNDMTKYARDFPAIYIQIARAYYKLNRFKTALESLEKVLAIIDNVPIFPTFIWPGTNDTIEETTPIGLKDAIKELNQLCRLPHKPTATCRYNNCLKTTNHLVPSELIYSNDPDFVGYVRMICEEKCHIEFHISCWKSYKESVRGIGKINDKDFLGRQCLTTDCINSEGTGPSIITSIEIIGADGQVKSVNKLDPKANMEQKAAEKKAKKKRSKLDDKENKEKVTKPKKSKEKKVKINEKKPVQEDGNDDEEDYESLNRKVFADPVKEMETRKLSLRELRQLDFGGCQVRWWDPRKCFYGIAEESFKASNNKFVDHSNDSKEVNDIKEYFFSLYHQLLKDEGRLKLSDVEDHWKEQVSDFFDVKTVLPNLTSICDLLMESNRFCQVEDQLCLAEHLEEGFRAVQDEVADTISFLMSGTTSETDSQHTDSIKDNEDVGSFSGEESEDKSDSESEEEEDDGSDEENKEGVAQGYNFAVPLPMGQPQPIAEKIQQPSSDGKLEDMLKELTLIKKRLTVESKGSDSYPATSETDLSKEPAEETSNETFETAHGSSLDTTIEDQTSPTADSPPVCELSYNTKEQESDVVDADTLVTSNTDQVIVHERPSATAAKSSEVLKSFDSTECDKGSQSEVDTKEKHMQTSSPETEDRLSLTEECDLYKAINAKVQELTSQLCTMTKENTKLAKELVSEKQIRKAQHITIKKLHEEAKKSMDTLVQQSKFEMAKKTEEHKKKEDELTQKMQSVKNLYTGLLYDNGQLKKEMGAMQKDNAEMKQSLASAMANIQQLESNSKSLEANLKNRVQKALEAQMVLMRTCWETQLNLHKKRCVERITEMQSWFSLVGASGEVETLPSYPLIHQNIMQWMETAKQLQQKESEFMAHYAAVGKKIAEDPNIEDLKPDMLPLMPTEPSVPPLDKIHQEITEKHLKKISELTQLVVTQQLQIEKGKEKADQLTQMLMSGLPPSRGPPLPTITTGLGGQLQYPYTGATALPPQYQPAAMSPSQDATTSGATSKLSDVHTLLQEGSRIIGSSPSTQDLQLLPSQLKAEPLRQAAPMASGSYNYPMFLPPPSLPPPGAAAGASLSMPPPPVGVAQSIFKTSTITSEQKKDTKQQKREGTPKPEQKVGSSRESTPGPTPAPAAPTPEKSKKKKKKASEAAAAEARLAAAAVEERIAAAISMDSAKSPAVEDSMRDDSGWNLVLPKSAIPKHTAQTPAPLTEGKMKNKKKLLDKLQTRFSTIPLKDIEDIVKQVRELNNGSLSGLPFDEIEARVERMITKRHIQKSSTMGLVKFSDAAWGTVKPQETKTWSNLQLEECTICLEPMRGDRTKVECNHEFHTACLRKWLKEKSVCPLCQNFTTMPDEFPAL